MEIKKTHIFLRENKYTGMGGDKIIITKVFECREYNGSLSGASESFYFKEKTGKLSNELEMITHEEFTKLGNETHEVLKTL